VIFANVRLQAGDDPEQLRGLGLPLGPSKGRQGGEERKGGSGFQFAQPCAAFDGCRCRIYPHRPEYCRGFECLLFQSVSSGQRDVASALGLIRTARRRASKVRRLLGALGDSQLDLPLAARFRRTARRLESGAVDPGTAATFGELTVAFHSLNRLLSTSFYSPGE
jgi:hypothetical protein